MPRPKTDENKTQYLARCEHDEEMIKAYPALQRRRNEAETLWDKYSSMARDDLDAEPDEAEDDQADTPESAPAEEASTAPDDAAASDEQPEPGPTEEADAEKQ